MDISRRNHWYQIAGPAAVSRFKDDSTIGVALGLAAHGIGTARAFQANSEMGAFAGLAMALSAVITAVILPWLVELP